MRYVLIILLNIFLLNTASSSDTTKCLFIGNSYTDFNNLPSLFKQLSASGGKIVYTEMSAPGGYTLEGHTQLQTTLDKINSRTWNYVILQEQSQYPVIPYYRNTSTIPFAGKLDSLVRLRSAATMFYMTWGRKYGGLQCINGNCSTNFLNYFHMQDSLAAAYTMVSSMLNAHLAPVGLAWKRARSIDTTVELFNPDNSHPSLKGSYLAACVFYTKIFGISPVGLTYYAGLPQNEALWLQQVAADVVLAANINNISAPNEFKLEQNYPNPFNPVTRIKFTISKPAVVMIKVYDMSGKEVTALLNSKIDQGTHMITFDASSLSSGVYFYTFTTSEITLCKKMVHLK